LIEAYCSNKAQFGENKDGFVLITEKQIDGIVKFANQYDLVGELTKSGFVRASIKGGDRWIKIDINNFVMWVKNKGLVKLNTRGDKDGIRKRVVRRRESAVVG
jgi:hypothetical protein